MKPSTTNKDNTWEAYSDPDKEPRELKEIEEAVDATGHAINLQPEYDWLINAEVQLQKGDKCVRAKVLGRTVGPDG